MRIGDQDITASSPPYVIAEIGVNHDGSPDRALELVSAAAQAGAAAVKFQFFRAADLLSRAARLAEYQKEAGSADPFAMLQRLELSIDAMTPAAREAQRLGLHAIVTVFSDNLVDEAMRFEWDALKTASPDIINLPLLHALMQTGLPMLVSCGAASLEEMRQVTQWLGDHPHLLMQCVSAYPTPEESASLAARADMAKVNPNALGYSDHTTAMDTGALAVASGAVVLEKHLTLDPAAPGPDHAMSLDPAQFAEYVRLAQRAGRMMGPARKSVLAIERDVREVSRQSLTTTKDLPAGHVLGREDLAIKRPGTGLPPSMLEDVLGRRLERAIGADSPLQCQDVRVEDRRLAEPVLLPGSR